LFPVVFSLFALLLRTTLIGAAVAAAVVSAELSNSITRGRKNLFALSALLLVAVAENLRKGAKGVLPAIPLYWEYSPGARPKLALKLLLVHALPPSCPCTEKRVSPPRYSYPRVIRTPRNIWRRQTMRARTEDLSQKMARLRRRIKIVRHCRGVGR